VIAYLDGSAVVKLFLEEVGSSQMHELWRSAVPTATSELTVVELACALAAASRSRRLEGEVASSVVDGSYVSERVDLVAADMTVVRAAARLGIDHGIRALDALHVASALVLAGAEPTLVSWDERQRRAAAAEGLPVYP
jgi:predicted nucleic acid-binding protein